MANEYCTVTDIEGFYKGVSFTTSTEVTQTEVFLKIRKHSRVIDGRIGAKYTVPIVKNDNPDAYEIMRDICTKLVVCELDPILRKGPTDSNEGARAERFCEAAENQIKAIQSGEFLLPGVISSSGQFKNSNVTNNIEPHFDKEADNW